MALNIPGPVAAASLRALGASVTKIEPPSGDQLRILAPEWYTELHAGQSVRLLDLRSPGGLNQLRDLLAGTDLLITSQRPRVIDRLGLSWVDLQSRYPRLCHVAILGQPSPNGEVPGHDLTYLAAAGLLDPPKLPRTLVVDLLGAERAAHEAMVLLLDRERSGRSGRSDVYLSTIATELAAPLRHGLTADDGLLGGASPFYRIYRTQDGWIALGALETHFADRVSQLIGAEGMDGLSLEAAFEGRTTAEWVSWAGAYDVPLERITVEPLPPRMSKD